ncbi:MAG TPA: sialate O-acetylesterase, partial [Ohtaekwangia sp.]|nr:sialate O-acetylesterase [Ohtaekwangia sp.]
LGAENAGGPYTLIVSGKNTITLSNVLVGDVWLCSGQSNMEWTVANSDNAADEIRQADFPMIRHLKVQNAVAGEPQQDIKGGSWMVCSPETVADFTAVGYFFARDLTRDLGVPIGLINSSWGGTHVETWTSREAFEGSDAFREMIAGLPRLDLDAMAREKNAAVLKKIEAMQGPLNQSAADIQSWREHSFDASSWKQMEVPGLWEQQGLPNVDGVIWYRKQIDLPAEKAGQAATLVLGTIDDNDETYVNGVKVGATNRYNERRSYAVPAALLKAGRNIIAVRVEDTGGGGGFYGEADALALTIGSSAIPLAGPWSFRIESMNMASSVGPNSYPTLLYNAMIHPLVPYGIKGAIWYQGESNAGRAYQYRTAFPLMITDWRKRWGQGDFPFYFVQLASFGADHGDSRKGSTWAELREAQARTLSLPHTGMVVTTDIGDPVDIHPRNKQDVGKRLAAVALREAFQKDIMAGGPVFQSMKVEGNRVRLSFTQTGGGLLVRDKYGYIKGFEVAGKDQQFHYAKAFLEGDQVIVFHDKVAEPVAVRFGWADDASDNNLFNKEGFPALPFRTDRWKETTREAKFTIGN